MENSGELDHTTSEGNKIYSTEKVTSPEEKADLLKKQQELDHAHSLYLQGKGNVIEFPKPPESEEEKKKAA